MKDGDSLDITPDYKRLFSMFMEDASGHSERVKDMKDREELRYVQGMVVALTIAAGAISSVEDLTAFRERMEKISAKLDAEGRFRDAVAEWPVGSRVRRVEDGKLGCVSRVFGGSAEELVVGVVWDGTVVPHGCDPAELEYLGEED